MTSPTNTSSGAPADEAALAALTVNEIIARWPDSIGALNALGLDTCCGGAATLGEAAADIGTTEIELIASVSAALAGESPR